MQEGDILKIVKYKKIKNKYKVYLDNDDTLDLYENIILKYNLLLKKEITDKNIDIIKEDNNKEEAYEKALNYINIKMRSTKEIYNYLKKKEYSNILIDEIIEKLKKSNFLNDELYIKSYINDKINLSIDGPIKIKNYLIHQNLDETIIDKYIYDIDNKLLRNKLDTLINKKIKTIKNASGNVLKYKVLNYFINLGYDKYMIEDTLSSKNLKNDGGEKEYNKLFNKYSKKLSGYELENTIRQKLYQKGYDYNEIKKSID